MWLYGVLKVIILLFFSATLFVYLAKEMAKVCLDAMAEPLIFLGKLRPIWSVYDRCCIDPSAIFCKQVELSPPNMIQGCFFGDLQRIFRASFAKAVAKKVRSLRSTFAAVTMKHCYFLVDFSQHCLASTLGCFPDRSRSCRLHTVWVRLSGTKVNSHNHAKEKHGSCESFTKAFLFYPRRTAVCR